MRNGSVLGLGGRLVHHPFLDGVMNVVVVDNMVGSRLRRGNGWRSGSRSGIDRVAIDIFRVGSRRSSSIRWIIDESAGLGIGGIGNGFGKRVAAVLCDSRRQGEEGSQGKELHHG